jgi:hypothetical protein
MNDWDRNNLQFLLNASDATIKDWTAQVSADDIDYAHELLARYSEELRERSAALLIEAKLDVMPNYPDANMVIDKIMKR